MADQPHYRVWADPNDGWVQVEKWNPGKNEFATVGRYAPDDGSLIVFMGSKVGQWEYWSGGNKLETEETNKGTYNAPAKILAKLLPEARALSSAVKSGNSAPAEGDVPPGGGGEDFLEGFDFGGGAGSAGPLPPSQQELDLLDAQAAMYRTQEGLLRPQFEEDQRSNAEVARSNQADEAQAAADLEAAKRNALADAINSIFDTSVRDADSRRAGAVQTLATTLPIAVSDQDAALLGRMQRGRNQGNPIETTHVPLDKAALNPTDLDFYQNDAEKRARALLGYAKGGVVSKLFRAAAGMTTGKTAMQEAQAAQAAGNSALANQWMKWDAGLGPKPTNSGFGGGGAGGGAVGDDAVQTDPGGAALLAAQAQAMADFRDYANQFGVVPQGIIDATLAYYGIPPGSITLPKSLTQQTLDQAAFQFTTSDGRRVQEFADSMAHDKAMSDAANASRERIAANGEANALAIAQGHDNTSLQMTRMQIGSNEGIAARALAENARQFDTRLAEDQRQFLAEAAANPRRVIEAAYYQAGMNPSQAATAFQNQISGQPGSVPGYPPGVAGQNPSAGGGGQQPAGGTPANTGGGTPATGGGGDSSEGGYRNVPPRTPTVLPPRVGSSPSTSAATSSRGSTSGTGPNGLPTSTPSTAPPPTIRTPIFHPVAVPMTTAPTTVRKTAAQRAAEEKARTGLPSTMSSGGTVVSSIASVVERALLRRMHSGGVVEIFQPSTAFEDRDAKRGNKVPGVHRADAERAASRVNKAKRNGIFAAAKGQTVEGPAVILIGEGLKGEGIEAGTHEYLLAPPGTVVAPGKKGETPTMELAMKALRRQIKKSSGMKRAASGYMSLLRKAATGTLIETSLIPGLTQGKKGSAFDPLGGATQQLRDVIPNIEALPNFRDYNRQSKTQRGLFESGLSAGRVDPEDVTQFINRGYEGFNPQVGAGQTARVGRFF